MEARTRALIVGGTCAAVSVIAVLVAWLAFADEPSETVAVGDSRATVDAVVTTITAKPSRAVPVTTTSSSASVTSASSTPDEPAEPCSGDAVLVTTDTDRDSYPPATTVRIESTAQNVSDAACRIRGVTELVIADAAGNAVLRMSVANMQTEGPAAGGGHAPGESVSWTTEWNQHGLTEAGTGEVPPGEYSVTVTRGSETRGSAAFWIAAD